MPDLRSPAAQAPRSRLISRPRCIQHRTSRRIKVISHGSLMAACQGPVILGLTGSIGMGKSTVSSMFQELGVPVLEADHVVHKLYAAGGAAVEPVAQLFPNAVKDGAVDRGLLSNCVVGNEEAMKKLEAVVHPLVEQERLQFLQQVAEGGAHPLVMFDIPLLFETAAQQQVDAVAVVSAPADLQQQRVMARPGMTADKFAAILARQVPDAVKRQQADYVINTGCSLEDTRTQVRQLAQQLATQQGKVAAQLLAAGASSISTAGGSAAEQQQQQQQGQQ